MTNWSWFNTNCESCSPLWVTYRVMNGGGGVHFEDTLSFLCLQAVFCLIDWLQVTHQFLFGNTGSMHSSMSMGLLTSTVLLSKAEEGWWLRVLAGRVRTFPTLFPLFLLTASKAKFKSIITYHFTYFSFTVQLMNQMLLYSGIIPYS